MCTASDGVCAWVVPGAVRERLFRVWVAILFAVCRAVALLGLDRVAAELLAQGGEHARGVALVLAAAEAC